MEKNTSLLIHLSKEDLEQLIKSSIRNAIKSHLNPQEDLVLNTKSAAQLLGVSLPTLNRWKNEKKIPCHKKGGRIFYLKEELIEALKNWPS